MREHTDTRGTILAVGQKVAYNQSGNVVVGTIAKITDSAIQIERPTGGISKVRNAGSVLVIFEERKQLPDSLI